MRRAGECSRVGAEEEEEEEEERRQS